eukprot:8752096-Alexandrium_andersonii.AAC.1
MSASLVGSEMCIRDRPWTPPTVDSSALAGGAARGNSGGGSPPSDQQGAVSYTHLTLPTICSV